MNDDIEDVVVAGDKGLIFTLVVYLFWLALVTFFVMIIYDVSMRWFDFEGVDEYIIINFATILNIWVMIRLSKKGYSGKLNVSKDFINKKNLAMCFIVAILMFFVKSFILVIVESFMTVSDRGDIDFSNYSVILSMVIIGPIAEELFFRGMLLSKLSRKLPIPVTILIQGIIFAAIHGSDKILILMWSGIMYGIIYVYTKSIIYPILTHMLGNTLIVILIKTGIENKLTTPITIIAGLASLAAIYKILSQIIKILKTKRNPKVLESE